MGKHGPNRLANYREVHDKAIRDLENRGFLLLDGLGWNAEGDAFLTIAGALECAGEIRVEVSKQIQILEGAGSAALVQTVAYSYNAVLDSVGNILRYDSPHPTHNRYHHVHRYAVLAGDKDGTITELTEDEWPTLTQVVDELAEWYYANYDAIKVKIAENRGQITIS